MLGKLPVVGRPTNLVSIRARTYCACIRSGWALFGHFFCHLSFLSFLPLWETGRYRLKYCLKGPLNEKQPAELTNKNQDLSAYRKARLTAPCSSHKKL